MAGENILVSAKTIDITDDILQSSDRHTSTGLRFSLPAVVSLNYQDTKQTKTTQQSSNLIAGNNFELQASGDLAVTGSSLAAGNQLNLSGRNVTVQNGLFADRRKSKGGSLFAGLGPGYLVAGASVNASDGSYQTLTPSQLVAKDINIQAGENTTIKASRLQAQDSINIDSPNLAISGEYQRNDSKNRGASAFVLVGPNGPVGGGAGLNAGYDKSGKYFAATLDAANINLNSSNQVIDGARINGQDINPHSGYSEGHQFSGGFGFGGGMPSVNLGFDDFSLASGAGPGGGFGSVGFKEFSIGSNFGTGLNGNSRTGLFAGAYGFGAGVGKTNINNHPDLIDFSFGYGPLAVVGTSQGGTLRTGSFIAGFKQFDTVFKDVDWQCFEWDAPIETKNSNKLISEIKTGDFVKAWNEYKQQFEYKRVLRTFERITDNTLHISLSNGQLMKVTPQHKILVGGNWLLAKDLKIGNKLLSSNNTEIFVQSIQIINKKTKVYNFEVEDNHTYVAYGVVVHNKCSIRDRQLVWLAKDEHVKPDDIELPDELGKAIAYLQGFGESATKDQVEALLSSLGAASCASNPAFCTTILENTKSLFSDFQNKSFPQPIDPSDIKWYQYGQASAHAGTIVIGAYETVNGYALIIGSIGAGGAGSRPTLGSSLVIASEGIAAGSTLIGIGTNTTSTGARKLSETVDNINGRQGSDSAQIHRPKVPERAEFDKVRKDFWKKEAEVNSHKYSSSDLNRMKKGLAPIGPDGYPMELHHKKPLSQGGTNSTDNLTIMSRTEHRLGENYKRNH